MTSPSPAPTSPPRPSRPGWWTNIQLFLVPAVVGGGTRALPDQVRLNLALAQGRTFGRGTVYLCYHSA